MGVPLLLAEDSSPLLTEFGFALLAEGVWEVPTFPQFLIDANCAYSIPETPNWNTLRQKSVSGKETSIGTFVYPTKTYELHFEALRETIGSISYNERRQLEDFIDEVNGGVYPFYYNDPDDNAAVNQLIGMGDGSTTAFQLARPLVDYGFSVAIQSPVPHVDPTIYVDEVPTAAFTLGAAGVVNFNSAPAFGATLSWSGNYYWLVRFDDDSIPLSKDMSWIWSAKKVQFSTVPL